MARRRRSEHESSIRREWYWTSCLGGAPTDAAMRYLMTGLFNNHGVNFPETGRTSAMSAHVAYHHNRDRDAPREEAHRRGEDRPASLSALSRQALAATASPERPALPELPGLTERPERPGYPGLPGLPGLYEPNVYMAAVARFRFLEAYRIFDRVEEAGGNISETHPEEPLWSPEQAPNRQDESSEG